MQKFILYINVHILHIQYIYTLQVCTSTSGIVIDYIGGGCQSPNPKKYTVLNRNFVSNLHNIFQKCNPGKKWDLPVIYEDTLLNTSLEDRHILTLTSAFFFITER